jgi:hypothetical protein
MKQFKIVYEGLVLFAYLVLVVLLYHAAMVKSTLEQATKVWNLVGIATCYRLDSLGIDGGKIFCTHPDWPWGPPSLQHGGYWVYFPG